MADAAKSKTIGDYVSQAFDSMKKKVMGGDTEVDTACAQCRAKLRQQGYNDDEIKQLCEQECHKSSKDTKPKSDRASQMQ